ncbi:MAG: alpha/beta hydrolase [Clostridia bacterium]|nr:alpha/beta hydrolase [Clostridia bacterium]
MKHERIFLDKSDDRVYIDTYVADDTGFKREAMLVIPGGGYQMVCYWREGEPVALRYFAEGFNTFVLSYRVNGDRYPSQLLDASRAIVYLKDHADELGIDPEKIYACGFSAGGHLAGSLAILHKDREVLDTLGVPMGYNRPRACVLCYPVVTAAHDTHGGSFLSLVGKPVDEFTEDEKKKYSLERNVDSDSAPVFIWHTAEDQAVPPVGSLMLAKEYIDAKIPVALHLYPYGPHGIALGNKITVSDNPDFIQPMAEGWVDESIEWLRSLK